MIASSILIASRVAEIERLVDEKLFLMKEWTEESWREPGRGVFGEPGLFGRPGYRA